MQYEPHLIGKCQPATGAIGGKLALVQLDEVLGLPSGAAEAVVESLSAAVDEAGHHVADVETLRGGLDPHGDTSIGPPRLGTVACLGVAADRRRVRLGAAHAHIVGDKLDQPAEHVVASQAGHEVDAIFIAPLHHVWAPVMAVTANGDVGVRPVLPDDAQQASQMTAYLCPDRVLPGRSSTATWSRPYMCSL